MSSEQRSGSRSRIAVFMSSLAQDVGFALRLLRKSPAFTLAVTLSLGLGIGANTAIFSLINAVLWRTLPVRDPEQLMLLTHGVRPAMSGGFTYQQYRAMREQQAGADLAGWSSARLNVSVDGSLEPTADGQLVTGNYFAILGDDSASRRRPSGATSRSPARASPSSARRRPSSSAWRSARLRISSCR
jgi:hypothetical protein